MNDLGDGAVMRILWLGLIGAVAVAGAGQFMLAKAFRDKAAALAAELRGAPVAGARPDLPPAVAAFARRAGAQPGARAAVLEQSAELRLKQGGGFSATTARQTVALAVPGFVWDARQGFGPLTVVRVIDSYVDGRGLLEARLFGSIRVARAADASVSLAEAYRYLAELPWAPDAILGNPAVAWRMLADGRAEAALDTPAGRAAVIFAFDAAGDIVAMEARDRPAQDAAGKAARYDWRARFWDYGPVGPRRLPRQGEVGYVHPEGFETYFKGRITGYTLVE
ncbi:DUF6544 family protein [Acidimangrovimonas pyrenivorans]|uniref:DUF6544 family protein n=1 Tax=Acidimangrovimonas pyrenivorans TaxID=2030798 RepID=A0ABV7AKW5_9RHOB